MTADDRRPAIEDGSLTRLDDIGGLPWPTSRGEEIRDRLDEKRPQNLPQQRQQQQQQLWTDEASSYGHNVTHLSRSSRQQDMMQRPEDMSEAVGRRYLSRSTSSLVGPHHDEAAEEGRCRYDDMTARHNSDVGVQVTGGRSKAAKSHDGSHYETTRSADVGLSGTA